MGYIGLGRGVLTELVNLAGAVAATLLAVNYAAFAIDFCRQVSWLNSTLASFLLFWGVFLIAWLLVHMVTRRLARLIKWEPFHWFTRGFGLLLGGLRGVWWAGVLVMALSASGMAYLQESVETKSVMGPQLLTLSRGRLERLSNFVLGRRFGESSPFPPAIGP